jgi:hypothetical protein
VVEVALAMMLVTGGDLLIRTVYNRASMRASIGPL